MATQWQGPHFIVIAAASALAFGGGYVMAGRSRPATSIPPPAATNTSIGNEVAGPTGIPGFDTNTQAPPGRRGRPDENELIARNAEPEGGEEPHDMGNPAGRSQRGERPARRPTRERVDEDVPPDQPLEDDQDYGPERM